jgi:hypothetical protein
MNLSLEPHQLVAHWVPGLILLLLATFLYPDWYAQISQLLPQDHLSRGFIWVVLPFVSGQLIDCFRNSVIEEALDNWWPEKKVSWDFFFSGDKEKVEKLRRSFFDYYVFDANLVLPALCFTIWRLLECICEWTYFQWHHWHWAQWLVCLGLAATGVAVTFLLVWDARSLRIEIAKHTKSLNGAAGDQSA